MIKDLEYLAGEETKGRVSGSEGARKAAQYIAGELSSLGISPAGEDEYFSYIDIFAARLHGKVEVSIGGKTLTHRVDFGEVSRFLSQRGNDVEGELLVVRDGDQVDSNLLKNKVVLIPEKPDGLDMAATVKGAQEEGVLALLIEGGEPKWFIKGLHGSKEDSIPVLRVRKSLVKGLEDLQGEKVKIKLPLISDYQTCQNVIGHIPGRDSSKTLVLSAHYDHLGDDPDGHRFPGAVDNGSGVAIVLEMARRLVQQELPFNVTFAFFTGEESGLLGARHFVKNTQLPVSAVINIDGVGYEPELSKMRTGHKEPGLWLADLSAKIISEHEVEATWIYGSEDSVAFQEKQIPAIGLGQKPIDPNQRGIHTPEDTFQQLYVQPIYKALEIVSDLVFHIVKNPSML
ncbi:M20/M25/M40 family metallo-hydrolase [Ornithinibacillus sp. 179-J 7C1 HS]|uniref:M20/M25/M40 family metallo-hydrolase n=1 Tax=Ornithinibacillus sp. 179-J 7C1 HS TaxID=3142384 RepID=UPI0039A2248E